MRWWLLAPGRRACSLGPVDLEGPDLDPEVGVEVDVDGEVAGGLLLPELGGGDVPLQRLAAVELGVQLGGCLGALVEGVERVVSEALVLVEREGLDVVVVEADPGVGVADRHADGEVVGERGVCGEGEGGEVGGVDGGGDHVGAEDEVEDEGEDSDGDEERDEDAAEAAEEAAGEALAGAAEARDGAAGGAHLFQLLLVAVAVAVAVDSIRRLSVPPGRKKKGPAACRRRRIGGRWNRKGFGEGFGREGKRGRNGEEERGGGGDAVV
nr:unnamed protein product [Digitaria exilis]